MVRCRRCGRHDLVGGPAGPGRTAPSPAERGGGVAPAQRPGAVLQILQIAVAVERPPVDAASPAAPVAGLRSARTGVVGLGPARAAAALPEPGSGRDGDLPGPAGLPAGHEASPPLAWLPGSDQPTKQAGTAKPEPHGASTVRPGGRVRRGMVWMRRTAQGATAGASSTTLLLPDVRPAPGHALRMRVGGFHHARRPASRCRVPLKTLAAMLGCALQPLCHGPLGRWLGSLNTKAAGQEAMSSQDEVGTVGRIPTATCSSRGRRDQEAG
jgi:hypothetical protein